jgi:hypothetical protein
VTSARYDPADTRTVALHPRIAGRRVFAIRPDGMRLEPQPDGLFTGPLPVLTQLWLEDREHPDGYELGYTIGPAGQLAEGRGFLTPEDAAVSLYPPAAQAHAVSVTVDGDVATVTIDTVPSRPLRSICLQQDGLWYFDPVRSSSIAAT